MELQKKEEKQGQGFLANKNGKKLENAIEGLAIKLGYRIIEYKVWRRNPLWLQKENPENLLIKNMQYTNIYGGRGTMEFYIKSKRLKFEGRIECRYQDSAGSVDEKFPYLYENCIAEKHPKNTVVVAEIKGAKKGSFEWFKDKAENAPRDRSISIFTLKEFVEWFA